MILIKLNFIFSLLLAIVIAFFAIANSDVVTINFLVAEIPVSQALVIFISTTVGALIVLLFSLVNEFKLKRNLKKESKELEGLKEENSKLKDRLESLQDELNNNNLIDQEEGVDMDEE